MRLATIRYEGTTAAALLDGDTASILDARDVGALLARPDWRDTLPGRETLPIAELDFAPLVPSPSKIVCVGLNYRSHIKETGEPEPENPTLFAKFARALIGAHDPIVVPEIATQLDWEVELVVVVGRSVRHADAEEAEAAIAGFTVGNDVSVRNFQGRTSQWLQGKSFESSTPVGPVLVTSDELDAHPDLEIRCEVDGDVRQSARTGDLLFGPADLIAYISQIFTLDPGDLIFTGTPGGIGQARKPPLFLEDGQELTSVVEGIGSTSNRVVKTTLDSPAPVTQVKGPA